MSIHFQQLHADVFEDRALPSVSFLTIPAGYFSNASVRIADQGLLSTPKPFTQATAMRFNDQGFGLVPLWMNANGNATYLIVNLRNAPPAQESVSFGPVSQRLSAGATRDAATDTVEQTVQEAAASPRTPTTNEPTPISYNPEQATRVAPLPTTPRPQEAPRFVEQPPPLTFANNPTSTPLLRDYSTSAVTDETPRVPLADERQAPAMLEPQVTPTPELTTPSEPPTLTVEDLTATPLAGMLPFNMADLEKETSNLLHRIANFGEDLAEEISASSEYVWLTAAAVVAGGAAIAARSTRPLKPAYVATGPLAAWKDKHDGQRG